MYIVRDKYWNINKTFDKDSDKKFDIENNLKLKIIYMNGDVQK